MKIIIDDLSSPEIASFLQEHIEDMRATPPPESKHALDLSGLKQADITFWSVSYKNKIVACGALKELSATHAEIKSMRTSARLRGKGLASKMLQHILDEAKARQYKKLSLETGSMEFFTPARALYKKFGFSECPPFANYTNDPNSIFMQLILKDS